MEISSCTAEECFEAHLEIEFDFTRRGGTICIEIFGSKRIESSERQSVSLIGEGENVRSGIA